MRWPQLRSAITSLFRRRHIEREMEDELRFHLEARADDLMVRGQLSRDEAIRQSRLELGGVEKYRERVREARGLRAVDDFCGDVCHALRQFRRSPAFAAVAIATLALGIGANTTIFSVVNAILLRPLPFEDSHRIVEIVQNIPGTESRSGAPERTSNMNLEEFQWWRTRTTTLSHLAVRMPLSATLARGDEAVRLPGAQVSPALFPVLGVPPISDVPVNRERPEKVVICDARGGPTLEPIRRGEDGLGGLPIPSSASCRGICPGIDSQAMF